MRTRLLGLFAAALLTVAGLTTVMATQTAEASDPPRYGDPIMPSGYQPIPVQWMYMQSWRKAFPDKPVLKVDTDHATSEGFYFAVRSPSIGSRNVQWVSVRYGMGCDGEQAYNLTFNPWLNTYWCAEDPTFFESYEPGYQQRTDACRAEKAQPWKSVRIDGSNECWNRELFHNSMIPFRFQYNQDSSHLAPWETSADLNDTSWNSLPVLNFWVPEPDACTGAPANSNSFGLNPSEPAGNVNVPDCKGQDLAPNCTAATAADPACGGPLWPNVPATGTPSPTNPTANPTTATASPTQSTTAPPTSVTSTQSVTDSFSVTGVATRTEMATVKLKRKTVRVSVTKTINGQQVTKTGTANIYVKRSAQATAESMLTDSFNTTGTATCTQPTQTEADNCAINAARAKAAQIAVDTYTSEMNFRAGADASTKALAEARSRATTAALDTPITREMIRKAKRQARQRALAQF